MKVRGKAREITVTQRSLADAIGLTPPRISQLIQEGVVIRDEKDKSGGVFFGTIHPQLQRRHQRKRW